MSTEMRKIALVMTHFLCVGVGFGIGIYTLPILIQPDSPSMKMANLLLTMHYILLPFKKIVKIVISCIGEKAYINRF